MFDPKLVRREIQKYSNWRWDAVSATPWQQARVRRNLQAWSVLAARNYRNTVNRNTGNTLKRGVR